MASGDYDAIVVGSGINGLAAAVHLAARKWKVLVLEASDVAGGAVRTLELTEPGFRHDLCAMNLSMFGGSAFHAQYREALTKAGLELVPAPKCFASIFRDHSYLGVGSDLEDTLRRFSALSTDDTGAWTDMLSGFGQDAPHIFALMGSPMPSLAAAKAVWKAYRALGLKGIYRLASLVLSSPRDYLDRHFDSPRLKAMMAAWGLHLDFAPDVAGGALFPYLESMSNQAFGMVIGKNGADTVIKAMCNVLTGAGGEIRLGQTVSAIDVNDQGRAVGVCLEDGGRITARKAVIANVHPRRLFGSLLAKDRVPAGVAQKVRQFRAGPGTMMIHLSLDALPDWQAGPELQEFAYVHLAPDMAMMSKAYSEAVEGLLPAEPALVVGQPTAVDPGRAPEGKHVLWVQVRVLPGEILGDASGEIAGRNWEEVKEAYADRVIGLIEGYAPGFSGHIRKRVVHSPADLERLNPNLVGGDSLSGSHHLDQNFLFRPFAGYSRYKTPVSGLYMCGASTWPGAGTGAGSGYLVARMLGGAR